MKGDDEIVICGVDETPCQEPVPLVLIVLNVFFFDNDLASDQVMESGGGRKAGRKLRQTSSFAL